MPKTKILPRPSDAAYDRAKKDGLTAVQFIGEDPNAGADDCGEVACTLFVSHVPRVGEIVRLPLAGGGDYTVDAVVHATGSASSAGVVDLFGAYINVHATRSKAPGPIA